MKKLSLLPALLVLGSLVGCGEPEDPWKDYTVGMDTQVTYDDFKVKLKVTKEPICGTERANGRGIKGEGLLEILPDILLTEVIVEPHNLQRLVGFLELNRGWIRQGLRQLSWCDLIAKLCPDCF